MPRSFRGYEVGEKIGSGGMSTLYKGVQTALGRTVAIKLLHPGLADDESFIARFEREARAASALGHPNIVSVIDFGSEDDVYYIVMEYVPGTDLRVVLNKTPKLPPEVVLAILEEVAHGLEAAHDQGIIHRDIKPGNVLLSTSGQVKIADFGLARQASDIERISALTIPGSVLGTPAYMSPEQAAGKDVDHRTDIYALGVMAYELFTGEKPFQGGTYSEIRDQIINREPPRVSKRAAVTLEIEALVNRMIEKDPDKRYNAARNLLRGIEDCMETLDPTGGLIKHRRRYLSRFAQDPKGFSEELKKSSISAHLDRGFYFQNLGLTKIDDAVREFRYVLFLDPENTKASSALDELKTKADESGVRLASDPGPPRGRADEDDDDKKRGHELTRVLADSDAKDEKTRVVPPSASKKGRAPSAVRPAPAKEAMRAASPEGAPWQRFVRPAGIAAGVLGLAFIVFKLLAGGGGDSKGVSSSGVIVVESDPSGAAVAVRGPGETEFRETGLVTNCRVEKLNSGEWDVRVALAGHKPEVRRVPVGEVDQRLALRLARAEGAVASTSTPDPSLAANSVLPEGGAPPAPAAPDVPPSTGPPGRLSFATTPPGAKITLRGPGEKSFRALPGQTPFTSDPLPPGTYDARADFEGFVRGTGRVEVLSGTTSSIALTLLKDEPAGDGFIQVVVVPFADVWVDGKLVKSEAKRVVVPVPATPGKRHVVELRHPTFGTQKFDRVAVTAGDTTDLGRYDFKFGKVSVFCKPAVPADVFVDGAKADRQTPYAGKIGATKHKIGVVKDGFIVKEVIVTDASGGTKTLVPKGTKNEVEVTVPGDGEVKVQFVVEKKG